MGYAILKLFEDYFWNSWINIFKYIYLDRYNKFSILFISWNYFSIFVFMFIVLYFTFFLYFDNV